MLTYVMIYRDENGEVIFFRYRTDTRQYQKLSGNSNLDESQLDFSTIFFAYEMSDKPDAEGAHYLKTIGTFNGNGDTAHHLMSELIDQNHVSSFMDFMVAMMKDRNILLADGTVNPESQSQKISFSEVFKGYPETAIDTSHTVH